MQKGQTNNMYISPTMMSTNFICIQVS